MNSSDGVRRAKRDTRQLVLSARDALTEAERAAFAIQIADALDASVLADLPAGALVALYAAKSSEVATDAIAARARARGLVLVFPRVVSGDRVLAFHRADLADLGPGSFGLLEPPVDAARVSLADLAVVITPGVAFNRAGGRVGWGGGYYDATLAQCPAALRVGVAFSCQIVERIRRADHDVALHWLITEQGAARCAP